MSASMKETVKNIAVFCAIAFLSGLILGLANYFTAVDPKAEAVRKCNALFPSEKGYTLVAENVGDVLYVAESENVVAILAKGKGGFKGEVQTFVFFVNGKIALIAMGENGETYLHKLEENDYYRQFYGWNGVTALPEIDGVTGATRSSTAVKNAVKAAASYFAAHYQGGQNG